VSERVSSFLVAHLHITGHAVPLRCHWAGQWVECCVLLVSAHMQDLQEITHEVHYENFRSEKMSAGGAPRKIESVLNSIIF